VFIAGDQQAYSHPVVVHCVPVMLRIAVRKCDQ